MAGVILGPFEIESREAEVVILDAIEVHGGITDPVKISAIEVPMAKAFAFKTFMVQVEVAEENLVAGRGRGARRASGSGGFGNDGDDEESKLLPPSSVVFH